MVQKQKRRFIRLKLIEKSFFQKFYPLQARRQKTSFETFSIPSLFLRSE